MTQLWAYRQLQWLEKGEFGMNFYILQDISVKEDNTFPSALCPNVCQNQTEVQWRD